MFQERTKHIDVHYHFIHEVIACVDIIVSKISTYDNHVAMMTKALPFAKFDYYLDMVAIHY